MPSSYSLDDISQSSYTFSTWIKLENLPDNKASDSFLGLGFQTNANTTYFDDIENLRNLAPSGSRIFSEGPRQGLHLENDRDFRNLEIGINRNDNYMTLFLSSFKAPETGIYKFRCDAPDDNFALWLDLDGNNLFKQMEVMENEQVLVRTGYTPNSFYSDGVSLSAGQKLFNGYWTRGRKWRIQTETLDSYPRIRLAYHRCQ